MLGGLRRRGVIDFSADGGGSELSTNFSGLARVQGILRISYRHDGFSCQETEGLDPTEDIFRR